MTGKAPMPSPSRLIEVHTHIVLIEWEKGNGHISVMTSRRGVIVKTNHHQRHDELDVIISLAIALGMVIGAVAAVWIWSEMSESVGAAMSLRSIHSRPIEMP
jgi:hypothetical protein